MTFDQVVAGMPKSVRKDLQRLTEPGASLKGLEKGRDYKTLTVDPKKPEVIVPGEASDKPSGKARSHWFWLVQQGEFGVWPVGDDLDAPPQKVKRKGEIFGELVAFGLTTERTATVKLYGGGGKGKGTPAAGQLLALNAKALVKKALEGNRAATRLLLLALLNECGRVIDMNGLIQLLRK